eukprot:jgi/Galph1/205/GphlegSOOS_G4914.1
MLRDWWLQLSIVSAAVLSSHKVSYAKSNDSAKDLEAKQSWKTCQISSWFRKNKEQEENVLLLWGGCAPPAALADKKDNYQTMANDQAVGSLQARGSRRRNLGLPKLVDIACSDIKSFAYSSQATALLTSKDELLIQQNDLSAQMDKGDTFRKVQIGKGQTEGIIFSPQQQLLVWTAKGNAYSLSLSEYGPLQRINDKFQGQKIKQISCGKSHCLALSKKGNVLSWGLLDDFGQLGRGQVISQEESQMPGAVLVPEGKTIVKVSCGDRHSAMVADDGTVWTFGSNQWSQLGNNEEPWKNDIGKTPNPVPRRVEGIGQRVAVDVACGGNHTLILIKDGTVYSCGFGQWGQVGHHNFAHMSSLARISSFDSLEHGRIKGIAAGSNHSCFITTAGNVYSLGANFSGQLGNGTSQPSAIPLLVKGLGSIQIEKLFCYGDVTAVIGHFKSSN